MKLFNKNFYKFLFSFVAVIAATLVLVLLVGLGAQ
jgi:hypothetical protein